MFQVRLPCCLGLKSRQSFSINVNKTRKPFSRNTHSWRAHVSPMFRSFPYTGNIASRLSFLFSRCKLCLRYTAGNFNENPSKRALAKICEQEQASTHLIFASNSSKGQILRALSNWMGPFDTPITQLQAKLDSTQSCYCASTAHDLPVISARGVRR